MGEWSEYSEDFPEEDEANYVNGRFDPTGARTQRDAQQEPRTSSSGISRKLTLRLL